VLRESDGTWRGADEVYAVLRPAPVGITAAPLWYDASTESPADPGHDSMVPRGLVQNSDRGGIILAMGILSWAIGCPIFGVFAWVMGTSDLEEMRTGAMDARGEGLTRAGRIIGMLHVLLVLAFLVVTVFGFIVWGVVR
jgi:hypothetical protein